MGAIQSRLTRRQLIQGASGVAGFLATGGDVLAATDRMAAGYGSGPSASVASAHLERFRSRPDLRPPKIKTRTVKAGAVGANRRALERGYLFIGPTKDGNLETGPLIVDELGMPVWFRAIPTGMWATNFTVREFLGQRVLTWWEGNVVPPGFGLGEGVIINDAYWEVARVRAGNGRKIDLHELQLTPEGTALVACYPQVVKADLSKVGGPRDGSVLESIIQEIDVRSGRVLFEWRSLDHVPVTDSHLPVSEPYDYLHINSIEVLPDGHLLLSGRHSWTLYKIHRRTGEVIWRLGGRHSNFAMQRHAQFAWQHDARVLPDGSVTVFDNGSDGYRNTERGARAIVLHVDHRRRSVRLAREFRPPHRLWVPAMGNFQVLPHGRAVVNWGDRPLLSEFAADGKRLADVHLPPYRPSYRGYRYSWKGHPDYAPAIATTHNRRSRAKTVYVSWNGATQVSHWRVSIGSSARNLRHAGVVQRQGFETAIPVSSASGYVAVSGFDASGRRLGTSPAVRL